MTINTDNLVSMTDANQNFSRVAHLVDEKGPVVILRNNVPRYLVISFAAAEEEATAGDEDFRALSDRIAEKTREAYEKRAKE